MANTWFVDRDGQERGPFTGQQLKAMATKGEVLPSDLVRRDDAKDWRLASSVKGLFEPVEVPKQAPPPVQPRQAASRSDPDVPRGETTPFWKHPALIAVSLVFCFPVGLVLVWLQNNWSTNKKLAWSGVTLAVWVPLIVFSQIEAKKTRNEVATAHEKWDAGDKASAVTTYRKSLDRLTLLSDRDRQLVLGRLIDFECEAGNIESAKTLLADAEKKNIEPIINSDAGKRVIAERKAEQARAEAARKEQQAKAEAGKKEQDRRAKMSPEDKLKTASQEDIVPAISLYNLYNGNEVAADKQYGGKTIIVEGTVQSVEKGGALTSTRILLQGRLGAIAVVGNLSSSSARSASLEKVQHGSIVRIQGKCKGKTFIGTVELSDCIFALTIE